MSFLFTVHSYLRWIIVAIAVVAIVRFLFVWIGRARPGSMDRGLMSGFVGMLDLQGLLGIIVLIWLGASGAGWPRTRFEHAATMVIAIAVAHIFSAKWRNIQEQLRARNYLLLLLFVLLLIFVGVMRLPQGWNTSTLPAV